ncbi:MAG: transketolase [Clostridiales bacterium]|jgi:transketolase|nr:transketolase [Clostridiales bacterium]
MTNEGLARQIRRDVVEMTHIAHASHVASALSIADIVAVLYNGVMNISPQNADDPNRDRFVLSKGHAGAAVYAALAEKGFIPREELRTYYGMNGTESRLSGHISHKGVPGVEISTGSLGQGVCVACGFALAGKKDGRDYRVFAVVGDGECDEGSVWEMALFAAHTKLNNYTVIVDRNNLQSLKSTEDTIALGDLSAKWKAFGWDVVDIDGHNCGDLKSVLSGKRDKPLCVIAHTVKGKGVSFMENDIVWHYRDPQNEQYEQAIAELGGDPL